MAIMGWLDKDDIMNATGSAMFKSNQVRIVVNDTVCKSRAAIFQDYLLPIIILAYVIILYSTIKHKNKLQWNVFVIPAPEFI
jgi:hypothetical protein